MKFVIVRSMLRPANKFPFSGTLPGANTCKKARGAMKRRFKFDDYEIRILILALNELRNQLIREERYTDAVDELLIKLFS